MEIKNFIQSVEKLGIDMYTGVPDSQLKALCDYLMSEYGICDKHIVAANEGAAVGLAAGHYLASGNPALVYMQNSGIGNAVNPICSLLNDKVYAIPVLFVIGWRGEPGVHDEPQHIFQGEITLKLLDCLDIKYYVITAESTKDDIENAVKCASDEFAKGKCFAFVVKKGSLKNDNKVKYANDYPLTREEAVNLVIKNSDESDIFVSTTGKLSRELFEAREALSQGHKRDFLTVGSMGHSSMIALSIAKEKKNRRVFCLDGDGAMLMHMGSVAVLGANSPENYIHVLINNGAHETVGGVPTVSECVDYEKIALACGYKKVYKAENEEEVINSVNSAKGDVGPVLIEIKTNLLSRADLGRPTTTPIQNRDAFMDFLKEN